MSRPQLIRSLSAPPELIDADLVDLLADASDSLDRLRSNRPDGPSAAWDRDYARAPAAYLRALASLQKHRKLAPIPVPIPAPEAAPTSTPDGPPASPDRSLPAPGAGREPNPALSAGSDPLPAPRNRLDRRRLEAFKRASPERRRQMLASRPSG